VATEAEIKSRQIIDAYHFLVSIAPETIAENIEDYTINNKPLKSVANRNGPRPTRVPVYFRLTN